MRLSFILFPPFLTQTVSARREIARTAVKRWSFSHTQPKILGAMFWILRRTRFSNAAALFNSINNNNSSESRPARKDYNKLTGDDQHLLQDKEDIHQETSQQSQNEDVKNKNEKLDNEAIFRDELTNNELIETDSESTFTDIDLDREDFTDDSDYDEALTCNVCDRSFASPKQLSSHKQKKRHFGCSACDSLFPSLMALEHHKEEFEHWSGDEDVTCTDSEDDEDETVVTEECERLL